MPAAARLARTRGCRTPCARLALPPSRTLLSRGGGAPQATCGGSAPLRSPAPPSSGPPASAPPPAAAAAARAPRGSPPRPT
eukprot:1193941-Pyramimonas_sp.AAC.1